MTESTKYPRPEGVEGEALYDLAWDIRENRAGPILPDQDPKKWLYWLCRYEGFGEWELEVKNPNEARFNTIIGYRD